VNVTCAAGLERRRFGAHVEISLFRISQEATSNAVRHGAADRVEILLDQRDGRLVLTVTDNGGGFDPGAATTGLGMARMHSRARSCGGDLRVRSRPGRCVVEASVPLESSPDQAPTE
jgi:signal transduction histidine kinase